MLLSPLLPVLHNPHRETPFRLEAGDALLLYTDGITEARTRDKGPLFGGDRLAAALAATHGHTAAETLHQLWQEASKHSGGYAVDDTALMLLRVTPAPDPSPAGERPWPTPNPLPPTRTRPVTSRMRSRS